MALPAPGLVMIREDVAWQPDASVIARAQLTRFMQSRGISSFEELHRRSIDDVAWFTAEVLRFLSIPFDLPYSSVLDQSRGPAWARWCVDAGLNISRCVDLQAGQRPDTTAIIWENESGERRSLTYLELAEEVATCAAGLRGLGIGRGDAVGILLPMMPETAIALFAIARVGGIAVPLFSGYGPQAIETRLNDVQARALVTCDTFSRRGKPVAARAAALEALLRCPAVEQLITVGGAPGSRPLPSGARETSWEALHALGSAAGTRDRERAATGAEDPLLVLYTSGTTGRPKGILHSHCGFPVKGAQDMAFGTDVAVGDRIFWLTDLGWMMGPWLIYGAVILGATAVFYDGAPDYPHAARMWEVVERHGVTVLGISPTLVRALMATGGVPRPGAIDRVRMFASTGEPWNPDPWWWLFDRVGSRRIPIINYSGGTEISGGILMGNPLLPIKPCSFPAPCPGIDADVLDESGHPTRGSVGELVIRKPWIGMARGFWNDPDRYSSTYWSRWPGIWVHGDWARVDADGHWYILGRSDDTLKVAGKRVGPAEVESVLVSHDAVAEAAVIGVPDELRGTSMVAFCVLGTADSATALLGGELADLVAQKLGKTLRPGKVVFVPALPKTRNAKVMRRLIRSAYLNEDLGDTTALDNPAALVSIRDAGAAVGR